MYYKKLIAAFLFFTITYTAFSQKHSVGIKWGGTCATFPDAQGPVSVYPGYEIGAYYRFMLSKRISIQVEPSLSNREFKRNDISIYDPYLVSTGTTNAVYSVNYFSAPLLLNYDLLSRDNFKLKIGSGITWNMLLSSRIRYTKALIATSTSSTGEYSPSYFQPFMFEIPVALTLSTRISKSVWFTISPRVGLGLTKLGDNSTLDDSKKLTIQYDKNHTGYYYVPYRESIQKESDVTWFFDATMRTFSLLFSIEKTF